MGISENVRHDMTWLVLTDTTQEIISRSKICTALDPKLRKLSLDPTTSTDFKLLEIDPITLSDDPETLKDNSKDTVFFKPNGEKDASSTQMVDRCKMVMLDENDMPRTDENGKTLYTSGPHPNNLPGQRFLRPTKIQVFPLI